jgi:U3 small nucleolar RNA-associated protein 14
LRKEA